VVEGMKKGIIPTILKETLNLFIDGKNAPVYTGLTSYQSSKGLDNTYKESLKSRLLA
jgi:hypothetical protein